MKPIDAMLAELERRGWETHCSERETALDDLREALAAYFEAGGLEDVHSNTWSALCRAGYGVFSNEPTAGVVRVFMDSNPDRADRRSALCRSAAGLPV